MRWADEELCLGAPNRKAGEQARIRLPNTRRSESTGIVEEPKTVEGACCIQVPSLKGGFNEID
jgi:hypothetical protein